MMILEANNVTKEFLRKRADSNVFCAVKDADLILKEGTLTALAGRSGSGKSTLLHMLAGLQGQIAPLNREQSNGS